MNLASELGLQTWLDNLPGGYGVVHGGSDGKDQRRPFGGTGSLSSYLRSGGDRNHTKQEEFQSSFGSAVRARARELRWILILRKHHREDWERTKRLQEMGCFGWGPGITE